MATQKLRCFLALPFSQRFDEIREAIHVGAQQARCQVVSLDRSPVYLGGSIQDAIAGELARADCIIADVSGRNPNVFFELGLAQAMGKGILLIAEEQSLREVPFDIREFRVITYSNTLDDFANLKKQITRSLTEFRRFPRRKTTSFHFQSSPPFFVDWDRLSKADSENLCQELLAQMGFRRLDWEKGTPEIDLVAELPRKDPDGFEYRELWLVSMGLRAPLGMFLEMASHEPEYLLHRFFRYSDHLGGRFSAQDTTPLTLLLVLFQKSTESAELEMFSERLKRRSKKDPYSSNMRVRIWDQNYLTSMIQRFPQIGYKYFSDEGRLRSKTRKSYEELYQEYASVTARQTKLIGELEDERNKRVRAERDAVWKDISFAAAHKIGNPIFAIETDLGPLLKRIRESRKPEAIEVVENIHSAVEKAKAFVEQFKSLARAQEIKPVPTSLKSILEDASRTVCNQGIECTIVCPPDLIVLGDPDRLTECFDELAVNATHWFDKPERKIEILVTSPALEPLPDLLDGTKKYALIHVVDNGCGIPSAEKSRIFDAFFTKHEHGTGLGLALVRRIIDGHGGAIFETGAPAKGADFEIYLPLPGQGKLLVSTKLGHSSTKKE